MSYFDDASLVMIPSGYKTSKVYSVKPTDGTGDLTFTRSNDTATRVNSSGLIERVRTNRVLYSEQFNDAYWTKTDITVTANTTANPVNGATTADTLTRTGAVVGFTDRQIAQTGIVTFSVYAKAGTTNLVRLNTFDGSTDRGATYNLTTGAITSPYGSPLFTTSQALSNGWYRISISVNSATYTRCQIHLDTINSVIVFGAQIETGDIATDYIATTSAAVSVGPVANVPRLDYLGSTCGKLLLEPQRTNSQTYSEQINNAAWGLSGVTVSANNAASPDGYVNADKVVETATTARHEYYGSSLSFSGNNAISFYAKYSGRRYFCALGGGGGGGATFDLLNGTVGENTAVSASIQSVGNGWYRCTVVINFTGTNQVYYILRTTASVGIDIYAGDGTSGVLFYGAQTELNASYATSYIPTLGAAGTRGADAAYKTGISSLIGQTEGTVMLELASISDLTGYLGIDDGSTPNRVILYGVDDGKIYTQVRVGGSVVFTGQSSVITGAVKAAIAYNASGCIFYVNGVQVATGTGATFSTLSQFNLTHASQAGSIVNQALLFKTRLTNAQLAELTTL